MPTPPDHVLCVADDQYDALLAGQSIQVPYCDSLKAPVPGATVDVRRASHDDIRAVVVHVGDDRAVTTTLRKETD